LILDSAPHKRVIDEVIAVDQHIAKGDDLLVVANPRGSRRVMLRQTLDRLANDLEIALHRVTQQAIAPVIVERAPPGGLADKGRSVPNIFKQLG
jgi:hypothetical protein